MKYSLTSTSGFTLVELMLAMSIFAIMSVMIMTLYINTSNTSRKLNMTRELSETAREITERIAGDVRDRGIDIVRSRYDDMTIANNLWKSPDYTQSGGEILAIRGEDMAYFYGKKQGTTLTRCTDTDKGDKNTHCGLYLITGSDWSTAYNLVDSFVSEEDKKRVKIENLRFYISGDDFTTKKVTLVMTLSLMPRIGVPPSLIGDTKLNIQTTMSERGWKK